MSGLQPQAASKDAAFAWLLTLRNVTRAKGVDDGVLSTHAALLAFDFQPEDFSLDALRIVAQGDGSGYFPPYDTIRVRLRAFIEDRRRPMPDASLAHLSNADAYWVQTLRKALRPGPEHNPERARRWLVYAEHRFPAAFRQIVNELNDSVVALLPPVEPITDHQRAAMTAEARRVMAATGRPLRAIAQAPVRTPSQQIAELSR